MTGLVLWWVGLATRVVLVLDALVSQSGTSVDSPPEPPGQRCGGRKRHRPTIDGPGRRGPSCTRASASRG